MQPWQPRYIALFGHPPSIELEEFIRKELATAEINGMRRQQLVETFTLRDPKEMFDEQLWTQGKKQA